MPFRLLPDESMPEAIRRIAQEQVGSAIAHLDTCDDDAARHVHEVRKHFKKLRGLLRLVRPELGAVYRDENAWYRDAARRLAGARDAQAMLDAFGALRAQFSDDVPVALADVVAAELQRRRTQAGGGEALTARRTQLAEALRDAQVRIEAWPLHRSGFGALRPGLQQTYARGRTAMRTADRTPTPEQFHTWRKQVKYHWYHSRLLQEIWLPVLKAYSDELGRLSDLLGDDHDLAVLHRAFRDEPKAFGGPQAVRQLGSLLVRRQDELRAAALAIGRRVYADAPTVLGRRWQRYWKAWRSEPQAQPRDAPTD